MQPTTRTTAAMDDAETIAQAEARLAEATAHRDRLLADVGRLRELYRANHPDDAEPWRQ